MDCQDDWSYGEESLFNPVTAIPVTASEVYTSDISEDVKFEYMNSVSLQGNVGGNTDSQELSTRSSSWEYPTADTPKNPQESSAPSWSWKYPTADTLKNLQELSAPSCSWGYPTIDTPDNPSKYEGIKRHVKSRGSMESKIYEHNPPLHDISNISFQGIDPISSNSSAGEEDHSINSTLKRAALALTEGGSSNEQPPPKKRTRKQAAPTKSTRKKFLQPSTWVKNLKKRAVNTGHSYLDAKGNTVCAKEMKPSCDISCRFRCITSITDEQRQEFHDKFWAIGDYDLQTHFLASCMRVKEKRRLSSNADAQDYKEEISEDEEISDNEGITEQYIDVKESTLADSGKEKRPDRPVAAESREKNESKEFYERIPREYFFRTDGEEIKICRTMLLTTLDISKQRLDTIIKKRAKNSNVITADKRGKHGNRANKISDLTKSSVRDHIQSLPKVEAHYVRADSNKEYLEETLNIRIMHTLYLESLTENNVDFEPANLRQYTDIFNTNFNIGFHKPKKDQCDDCFIYHNSSADKKEQLKISYDIHCANKEKARELKNSDRKYGSDKANINNTVVAAYDYQKILTVPKAEISCLYFKRKLSVYNFTIADRIHSDEKCYCYDESIGNKGANEVASFVHHFIGTKFNEGFKDFRFHSDNCSGQNRNRFVFAMYLYTAATFGVKIIHRFLERGHTQNDADTVHSVIERRSKRKNIFTPSEWYNLIRSAKDATKSQYQVIEVQKETILDWKSLVEDKFWVKNNDNIVIPWSQIREIYVDGDFPGLSKYKTSYDSDYLTVDIVKKGSTKILPHGKIESCYNSSLKISNDKILDLVKMCEIGIIPVQHAEFYQDLKNRNDKTVLEKRQHIVTEREVQSEIETKKNNKGKSVKPKQSSTKQGMEKTGRENVPPKTAPRISELKVPGSRKISAKKYVKPKK